MSHVTEALREFDAALTSVDRRLRVSGETVPDLETKEAVLHAYRALEAALGAHQATHGVPEQEMRDEVTRVAGRWLFRSRHFAHSYHKPHGYPGDYRILEWMYDLAGSACSDPSQPGIVNCLDYIFSKFDPTTLLPERRAWLEGLLKREYAARGQRLTVLDVAAGGARYFRGFLSSIDATNVQVTLVDQDASALAYCRTTSLAPWADRVTTRCVPIKRLREELESERWDVILSAGLLDYLDDSTARELLTFLSTRLTAGGVIGVTNVHPSENSRVTREWIVNWPLILRDETELSGLFPRHLSVDTHRSKNGALVLASGRAQMD